MTAKRPKVLYIHAGAHKTGTTAIQAFLSKNARRIEPMGIHYPVLCHPKRARTTNSHNPFFHYFAKDETDFRLEKSLRVLSEDIMQAPSNTSLVSAESIWRHTANSNSSTSSERWKKGREQYLRRVRNWIDKNLPGFEIHVFVTLRAQSKFAESDYLENILKRSKSSRLDFENFREVLSCRHLQYFHNLEIMERVFHNVHVSTYDELVSNGNFYRDSLATFGLDVSGLPDPGIVRKSFTRRQAKIKRSLAPLMVSPTINNWTNNMLKGLIGGGANPNDEAWPWRSEQEKRDWQERFTEENEKIRARYRPDLSVLFPLLR